MGSSTETSVLGEHLQTLYKLCIIKPFHLVMYEPRLKHTLAAEEWFYLYKGHRQFHSCNIQAAVLWDISQQSHSQLIQVVNFKIAC